MLETNVMFRQIAINNGKLYSPDDSEIEKLQRIIAQMLCDIDSLCRRHGLTYFLCGGSALGALRHSGFIPWDDDADVAMPRADYERFYQLFESEYGDKYNLQSIHSTDTYDLTFMKMRKKGTRYVELFETEPQLAGVFIDIYPLDNVPNGAFSRFFHGAVSDFLHLCLSCVRIRTKKARFLDYLDSKKARRLIRIKAFIGACLGFFSLHKWCIITENWSKRCRDNESEYVTFPNGRRHYFGEMCKRRSFFPVRESDFCGMRLFTLADPTEYLTKLYGDYLSVPAESHRENHSVLEFDLGDFNG